MHFLVRSFNQPKFCTNASWVMNATTLADNTIAGLQPYSLFIDTNDTVYTTSNISGRIWMWPNGSSNFSKQLSTIGSRLTSLFVTSDNLIFIGYSSPNIQVDRWLPMNISMSPSIGFFAECSGLFVDFNSIVYCSQSSEHQVVTKPSINPVNAYQIIAGTGCSGSNPYQLDSPMGIFVNASTALYVADCGNDRIQLFLPGQLVGITVAGNGTNTSLVLNCPTGITLDADGYLFIADSNNHRIMGSDQNGFRCLVGCGSSGSSASQLNNAWSLQFDKHGNIFVLDRGNQRIQKFMLSSNPCSKSPYSTSSEAKKISSITSIVSLRAAA